MRISEEKWSEIRAAVECDDVETFQRLVIEHVRITLVKERWHQRVCDQVRSRERGLVPFFAFDR